MSITLKSILSLIDEMIPTALAESWDNVGLQIGDLRWPVKKIQVALDPTPEVIDAACQEGIDLLLTHHPLIFKPLKQIDLGTPQGALLAAAVSNKLAVYTAHTNFDRLSDGLNDILARRIGLKEISLLENSDSDESRREINGHGLGRIGRLPRTATLKNLASRLKSKLALDYVRIAGRSDLRVERVALCTGSGSSLLDLFIKSGAQVYISGDLRYHDARTAEALDLGLIDIGHFPSEHLMVEALARRLQTVLKEKKIDVTVSACQVETDPFALI